MHILWTPAFIQERLGTLTERQKALVNYHVMFISNPAKKKVSFKQFGYDFIEDYEEDLAHALKAARHAFAQVGIRRMDDLRFEDDIVEGTWETRIEINNTAVSQCSPDES